MSDPITGRASKYHRSNKDQNPWVQRTGPTFSPLSIVVLVALTILAAVLALASTACTTQSAVSTQTDNFTVGKSVTLKVNTLGGRIEVAAGSDNVVTVTAELRDIRRIDYEVIQSGDEIIVTAEKTHSWWFPAGNTAADISVTVPAATALRLKTSNGEISVQGTTGGGILDTSNGTIRLEQVEGDFEAGTSNGAVDIQTIKGSASVKTSNGRVALQDGTGEFNVRTSNGAIVFSGELTPGGSNRLVTSNGRIEVELQGVPSVTIDASTSNGEIKHPDVAILATQTDSDHLVGTIGAGQADLFIETSNGDVVIE